MDQAQIGQVIHVNLNVTEVLVSDFKNAFSRNFQLHSRDPIEPSRVACSVNNTVWLNRYK